MKKIIFAIILLFSFIGIANASETICHYPLGVVQSRSTYPAITITFDSNGNYMPDDNDFLKLNAEGQTKTDNATVLETKNINAADLKGYGVSSCPSQIYFSRIITQTHTKYYVAIKETDPILKVSAGGSEAPITASILDTSKSTLPSGGNVEVEEEEQIVLEGRVVCPFPLRGNTVAQITYDNGQITSILRQANYTKIRNNRIEINDFTHTGELVCPNILFYLLDYSASGSVYDISFKDNLFNRNEDAGIESSTSEIDMANAKYRWYDNYEDYRPPSCKIFGEITSEVWTVIRILAPALAIIFGAMDFLKAIAASDDKDIQKSVKRFTKRLVILVVIFLLPTIINLIIGLTQYGDLTACFGNNSSYQDYGMDRTRMETK